MAASRYEDIEEYEEYKDLKPEIAETSAHQEPAAGGSNGNTNGGKRKYNPGSILRLNQRSVAIYKMAVPEKGYHVVLFPGPGGLLKSQGLELEHYAVEELGLLTPRMFDRLQSEMHWNRDLIIFHCYTYEDAAKVQLPHCEVCPHFKEKAETETRHARNAALHPEDSRKHELRRGQRLQIMMSGKAWSAVYWGKDLAGHVLAHNTGGAWALMHIDLDRYQAGLKVEPQADQELVRQIEAALPRE
jgi:hypothetical protein